MAVGNETDTTSWVCMKCHTIFYSVVYEVGKCPHCEYYYQPNNYGLCEDANKNWKLLIQTSVKE